MIEPLGWYAINTPTEDLDDELTGSEAYPWAAALQCAGHSPVLAGSWFATEEECLRFIREEVLIGLLETKP